MIFFIKDTSEGVELYAVQVGNLMIPLTCSTKLTASEIVRLAFREDVELRAYGDGAR